MIFCIVYTTKHYDEGGDILKKSVIVKVHTGYFERIDFKLKAAAEGLTLKPSAKGGVTISIPAETIRSITFYEVMLKMEIQAADLTEVYFKNERDWLESMADVKETLGLKIICEMN